MFRLKLTKQTIMEYLSTRVKFKTRITQSYFSAKLRERFSDIHSKTNVSVKAFQVNPDEIPNFRNTSALF